MRRRRHRCYRKASRQDGPAIALGYAAYVEGGRTCRPNGAPKIRYVRRGLETQQVVLEQITDKFSMVRRGDKQVRRRERYMEEKTDPIFQSEPPQRRSQGDKMIVVNPDQVIIA